MDLSGLNLQFQGRLATDGQLAYEQDGPVAQDDLGRPLRDGLAEDRRRRAELRLERVKKLLPTNALSREEYDTVLATYEKSIAAVGAGVVDTWRAIFSTPVFHS